MTWIKTISYTQSMGKLRSLYNRVKGPNGQVDRILMAHSLRPNTLEGHMALYKNVLHHSANHTPKWFLEALGLYVSLLNRCQYCVQHHFQGMKRLIRDDAKSKAILQALKDNEPKRAFEGKEKALMIYAEALTMAPSKLTSDHAAVLRAEGASDEEILEANQVIAYFAYANRTVLGLGVTIANETLGLAPTDSDDASNWNHR